MIIEHAGKRPRIDPTCSVAPDATVCGDVTIGQNTRVLYGARIIGENGGKISIGCDCIVMENAVIRATPRHPCTVGDSCLIGPNAHVVGAVLEDEVFVATAVAIFHSARLGRGAEVRPHATVHLRTNLPASATVPIGWVAVGDPVHILSPDRHEEIWAVQEPLNFPDWVYGVSRDDPHMMRQVTRRLSESLSVLASDCIIDLRRDVAH
ncbi:MAG: gamma carbonic anhydrase family protein [Terriglobales bacterium]|jgi:carbonic anhydrase/acetyltransferase-like protein (isoleucine patch superfamily)